MACLITDVGPLLSLGYWLIHQRIITTRHVLYACGLTLFQYSVKIASKQTHGHVNDYLQRSLPSSWSYNHRGIKHSYMFIILATTHLIVSWVQSVLSAHFCHRRGHHHHRLHLQTGMRALPSTIYNICSQNLGSLHCIPLQFIQLHNCFDMGSSSSTNTLYYPFNAYYDMLKNHRHQTEILHIYLKEQQLRY